MSFSLFNGTLNISDTAPLSCIHRNCCLVIYIMNIRNRLNRMNVMCVSNNAAVWKSFQGKQNHDGRNIT